MKKLTKEELSGIYLSWQSANITGSEDNKIKIQNHIEQLEAEVKESKACEIMACGQNDRNSSIYWNQMEYYVKEQSRLWGVISDLKNEVGSAHSFIADGDSEAGREYLVNAPEVTPNILIELANMKCKLHLVGLIEKIKEMNKLGGIEKYNGWEELKKEIDEIDNGILAGTNTDG